MMKVKEFFTKLKERISDFISDHPTCSIIIMYVGIYAAWIGGIIAWIKGQQKKVSYWEKSVVNLNELIEGAQEEKKYALEMIQKLSNK